MDVILSTRNPSKLEQIRGVFANSKIKILSLDDVGIEGEGVEDGLTLKENALKKARYAFQATQNKAKFWFVADDTGLFIKALDGKPGIKAARWAGGTATTDEITQFCLKQLEGADNRSAMFETVVAIVGPDGREYDMSGRVNGEILETPRCKPQPKMPYSPIFMPDGYDKVWAEMSVDEENAISHRGQAFRLAKEFLEQQNAKL